MTIDEIPEAVTSIGNKAFCDHPNMIRLTFKGTPTTIAADAFDRNPQLLDIYVPWSEGEVANAPWGATNATIHYNYIGGN